MAELSEMTKVNLANAFSGESQAHMRYQIYSNVADQEGYEEVSRLFDAIAYAETIHASNHLKVLPRNELPTSASVPLGLGNTIENLQFAYNGEQFEVEEMYPVYKSVAEVQDEGRALRSFDWALSAEVKHKELYDRAIKALRTERSFDLPSVQVCKACGYTAEGEKPEECPICGAKSQAFIEFA